MDKDEFMELCNRTSSQIGYPSVIEILTDHIIENTLMDIATEIYDLQAEYTAELINTAEKVIRKKSRA